MNIAPGKNVGPYEILGPLGAGGMGEVWRARDDRIGRDVAIKVLPASFASDVDRLRRFESEARAAGQLNDPNVLTVFDVGTHEGAPYLVTELLEGETLRERLAEGPLPPQKALEIARQLARGLAAAHEHGIVHRDLKPENIFVMKDGRAKILDFGLARQADIPGAGQGSNSPTVPVRTDPGTVLGSIGYMAPEQVRGQLADARSDIFAFGAVLFEMLTGRKAFEGDTAVEVLNAILKEDPPPPSTLRPSLPRGVDLLVRRCLEKSAEERYRSARDLAFHIFALSTDSLVAQSPSSGFRARPVPRRRFILATAAVLLSGALVGLTALVLRRSEASPLVFERLTYLHGSFLHARFAPDGQNVIFGASLEGRPTEVFLTREKSRGARPLGIGDSDVMGVSASGDIAILRKTRFLRNPSGGGTLATVPLTGGSPREIATSVIAADIAPNGRDIALLKRTADEHVVEYPPGNTILKSQELGRILRISPDGESVLVDEGDWREGTITLVLVDRKGGKRVLSRGFRELTGAAFTPDGREILATGNKGGASFGLLRIDLQGHERLVWRSLELPILHDIAKDGRLLLERSVPRVSTLVGHRGDLAVKDLSWTDTQAANAFSNDGRSILFRENRAGGGEASAVFLRSVDGSPPIQLGDGIPNAFSPDGRWVLTVQPGLKKWSFTLLPVGPGTPRLVDTGKLSVIEGFFVPPEGKRILFGAADETGKAGAYVMDLEKGKPKPLEGMSPGAITWQISPDGRQLAITTREKPLFLYDVERGTERSVPNARPGELPFQWSADGRSIWLGNPGDLPVKIDRIDVATGTREAWVEVPSPVPPDVVEVAYVALSEDGATWLAVVNRIVASDLFIASGVVAR